MLLVYFCLVPVALSITQNDNELQLEECGDEGDCMPGSSDCHDVCGCDSAYIYNATTGECMIKKLNMETVVTIYDSRVTDPEVHESFLARNIRAEAESVFQGVMIAAIFFITCAAVCAFGACIYCCRINYSDHRLAGDIKALAEKLGRDHKLLKGSVREKGKAAAGESCTVVVEDAGVFVA